MAKKWKKEEKEALEILSRFAPDEVAVKLKEMERPKERTCIITVCDNKVAKKGGKYCKDCLDFGNKMYGWKYAMRMVQVLKESHGGVDALTVLGG